MSESPESPNLNARIRTSQIIAGALMMGVVFFATISILMDNGNRPPMPVISMVAVFFTATMIVVRFIIPDLVTKTALKGFKLDDPNMLLLRLHGIYQTRLIISLAMLEGAAMFDLVAYMTEREVYTLGLAGVLLILMAFMFPTMGRYETWASKSLSLETLDRVD